jgi:molybdenum cofactor biosynthesis enzyme MoaA
MRLEEIGFYTLDDNRAASSSHLTPLHRCELILTDACNFSCAYCRGLPNDCGGNMKLDFAKFVVLEWCKENLQNIRFSGGEPLVYKGLVELVKLAKYNRVKNIAISSNGSFPLERYLELIEAGVNDFSISLDACCAADGDKAAGDVKGSWEKVVANIKALSKLTYVTVGVVLTEDNLQKVLDIVRFAHSLGVADIRVIPAAQLSKNLGQEFIASSVDAEIIEAHPILRYRMSNVANEVPVRGLNGKDAKRCHLALDDMAVSGKYHFPCIIYMREKGQPIGEMKDIATVREERRQWVESHDCKKDFICRANCLDVCVKFNNEHHMNVKE